MASSRSSCTYRTRTTVCSTRSTASCGMTPSTDGCNSTWAADAMLPSADNPLLGNTAAVLGLLAATLGFVFWGASREQGFWKKFYAVVPAILQIGRAHV